MAIKTTSRITISDLNDGKGITLAASAQIFTKPKTGSVTPSTITVTGTTQYTTIATWQYSTNGGAFTTTLPTGVTRSGNTVTINGTTMSVKTITVKAFNGVIQDTVTIAKVEDGVDGNTGATGKGITSITEEYAISTSKITAPADASFSTTRPTWTTGSYIWTRSKIVYNNPTSTVYTTKVVSSEWEAVNEIEVGGRNLLKESLFNSDLDSSYWFGSSGYSVSIDGTEKYNDTNSLKITATQVGSAGAVRLNFKTLVPMELSSKYTFSFYAKALENTTFTTRIGYGVDSDSSLITTEWEKHTMTFTTGATAFPTILPYYDKVTTLWIAFPKLEKGNKATDWTQAPEDVQAEIDGKANSDDLQDVQEKVGDLTGAVGNKAEKSDLQSLVDDFLARNRTIASDKAKAEADLSALEARTASVELEFGETKSIVTFVDTVITESEEGVFIGDKEATMGLLLQKGTAENPGRISFMDNGIEVAFISGQIMQINHGVFVKSLTVGKYKAEMIPDTDILAWQFVG